MTGYTYEEIFDPLWQGRMHLLDSILDAGETSLARVLALFRNRQLYRSPTLGCIHQPDGSTILNGTWQWHPATYSPENHPGPPLPNGRPLLSRTLILGGRAVTPFHAPYDSVPVSYLLDVLRHQPVDAIIELGSGAGQRLFELYLNGGPANIPYFGAELHASGRALAERMAALEPALDFRSLTLDLKAPDLSALAGYQRVLLFSNAAICCVEHLPDDFFTILANAAPSVIGVHFELLGHQGLAGLTLSSLHADSALATRQNVDFIPRLLAAERDGTLTLDLFIPHSHNVSSHQLATIAHWHAHRRTS